MCTVVLKNFDTVSKKLKVFRTHLLSNPKLMCHITTITF